MLTVSVLKTEDQKRQCHTNYKYLIRSDGMSCTAYHTDKGFEEFLKRNNMKLKAIEPNRFHYVIDKVIEDRYFWNLSEIENIGDCTTHYGLCNGSLVTCYTRVLDNKVIIYRPNPNAKNVYNALPLHAHIEYQKIYG